MRPLVLLTLLLLTACSRPAKGPGAALAAGDAGPSVDVVNEAQALRTANQHDQAVRLLTDASQRAKETGDGLLFARAQHKLGDLALDGSACPEAAALYLRAFNLYNALGELALAGLAANDLGLWQENCDEIRLYVRDWYQVALELRRKAGDVKGVRVSASNLARAALAYRQIDLADTGFTESLEAARKLGDLEGQRKALMNLSVTWAFAAVGDSNPQKVVNHEAREKSRAYFAQAVEVAHRVSTPYGDECTFIGEMCALILGPDAGVQ